MPKKHEQASHQSTKAAAKLIDLIDSVPWPITTFVTVKDGTSLILHTFRPNDPDVERLRKNKRYYEVGTYNRGVHEDDLITDLAEAWAELK